MEVQFVPEVIVDVHYKYKDPPTPAPSKELTVDDLNNAINYLSKDDEWKASFAATPVKWEDYNPTLSMDFGTVTTAGTAVPSKEYFHCNDCNYSYTSKHEAKYHYPCQHCNNCVMAHFSCHKCGECKGNCICSLGSSNTPIRKAAASLWEVPTNISGVNLVADFYLLYDLSLTNSDEGRLDEWVSTWAPIMAAYANMVVGGEIRHGGISYLHCL